MNLNIKPWTREGIIEKERAQSAANDKKSAEGELDDIEMQEENKKEEDKEEDVKQLDDTDNQQPEDDSKYDYEAVGVVVHSGSAEGGHYYSYIKDRKKGKWYEFNDTNVTPFDLKNLAEETFGGEGKDTNFMDDAVFSRSRNAYLIIYERKYPEPLKSAQLVNPNREYVNGIPKNVYQHIWDENMLFMKTMYFYDPDYLNFLKDYLFMNHFERKLYMNELSLTSKLFAKKEIAEKFGIRAFTGGDWQMNVQSIDIFDDQKVDMDVDDDNKEIDNDDNFNPDVDLNQDQVKESALNNLDEQIEANLYGSSYKIVDTSHIDPQIVESAKQTLLTIDEDETLEMQPSEIESLLKTNPGLCVIKFSTSFILRVRHMMKDSSLYISILQHLNSLFEINTDGCIWFLKLLTHKKEHIIDRLLEWKSEEEREHFRAIIITAISLVAKNEEKEFFDESGEDYLTETVVSYNSSNDVFYSHRVPKSALIRFMQVFFEKLLDDARKHWRNFEDYFQVLFYFVRLGHLETKYLVKAKGILQLLDFVINNSPPFNHGKDKPKMGNAAFDPNFMTPIDILSQLIRSCVTSGTKQTESYSSVSLIQNSEHHIELPEEEVKPLMSRLCFTVDLINKQYNESVLAIVLHLCWGDYDNSWFFLNELIFSSNIQKSNISELGKRLNVLREILKLEDPLQEQRIEIIFGLDQAKSSADELIPNIDEYTLLHYAELYRKEYPYFALKIIKIMSDMWENPKMLLYLTRNKDKIIWVRDFLDSIKMEEDQEIVDKLRAHGLIYDIDSSMPIVNACINSLSQVFPDGSNGFRARNMQKQEEGYEASEEVDFEHDGIFDQPNKKETQKAPTNPTREHLQGADDDFMNVSSAPRKTDDIEMTDSSKEAQPKLTDEERAELNDSFNN